MSPRGAEGVYCPPLRSVLIFAFYVDPNSKIINKTNIKMKVFVPYRIVGDFTYKYLFIIYGNLIRQLFNFIDSSTQA